MAYTNPRSFLGNKILKQAVHTDVWKLAEMLDHMLYEMGEYGNYFTIPKQPTLVRIDTYDENKTTLVTYDPKTVLRDIQHELERMAIKSVTE